MCGSIQHRRSGARFVSAAPFLVFALLGAAFAGCNAETSRPVRVVLITLDTLRLDAIEERRGQPSTMPLTRAWAADARTFERHYAAASSTQPTHATLLTAQHPWQHGITYNGLILGEEISTLSERMSAEGFRTAAVVSSFPLHRTFGFAQGFETFFDDFQRDFIETRDWLGTEVPNGEFFSTADHITERAFEILEQSDGRDEFLWFHFFDPHAPYGVTQPRPMQVYEIAQRASQNPATTEAILAQARRLYDADVRFLDRELDRLLERLKRDEERYDTHVFVTADHGESFGEGGVLAHGSRLSEEQIHVPLIVRSSRVEPGVDDRPTGSIDVAHAMLAAAGLGEGLVSSSLFPAVGNGTVFGMFETSEHSPPERRTDGRHVQPAPLLFYSIAGERILTGTPDRVADESLSEQEAEDLSEQFAGFERSLKSQSRDEATGDGAIEALRALGYVE
jgi:arylsulfatase